MISVFNLLLSGLFLFVGEYISGEKILSDSIGPSKDLDSDVMLTENEVVTIVFRTRERYPTSELLNIVVVDPQNKEYFWEEKFYASSKSVTRTRDFFSFTPEVSGIHHIKISNADFQTDVKFVSGMANPREQPLFLITMFVSFLIMFVGVLSLKYGTIMESIKSRRVSVKGALNFCIALSISLIIMYNTVGL